MPGWLGEAHGPTRRVQYVRAGHLESCWVISRLCCPWRVRTGTFLFGLFSLREDPVLIAISGPCWANASPKYSWDGRDGRDCRSDPCRFQSPCNFVIKTPIQPKPIWFPTACLFSNHPMYFVSPPFCLLLRFPNLPRLACILVLTCLAILAHRAFLLICRFFAIHLSYVLSTHSFLSSNWDQSFWSHVISFSVARLFLIYIPLLHLLHSSSLLCDLSLLVSLFLQFFCVLVAAFPVLSGRFSCPRPKNRGQCLFDNGPLVILWFSAGVVGIEILSAFLLVRSIWIYPYVVSILSISIYLYLFRCLYRPRWVSQHQR